MKIDVEERSRRAKAFFLDGYNCSQSVFLAYCDLFGIDERFGATLVAPLGGGMGRLREVCGTVSASFIIAGLKYPAGIPANTPEGKEAKTKNYTVIQELAERFKKENGSIVCRELLGLTKKRMIRYLQTVQKSIINVVHVQNMLLLLLVLLEKS